MKSEKWSASWRQALPQLRQDQSLRSWLAETGSLTARLQAQCVSFRVRLLSNALEKPLSDEGILSASRRKLQVREVMLECDGQPVIFAHTVLSTATGGRLSLWLARLGSRSLGSLLFSHPGFVRGPIEYCRLDARHRLYQRAATCAAVPAVLWARRSRHRLGQQVVMVTEVFLPAIPLTPSKAVKR